MLLGENADSVRSALDSVTAHLQDAGPQAALIVFYSGHADATALHLGGTHLPIAEITTSVRGAASGLRMLIVDACRSGAVSRIKGLREAGDFEIKIDQNPSVEGTVIITSSTAGENSQESDILRASFFSHHLVNGLRGAADRNGDERVTLAEVYAYTYAQTLRSSGRTLNLQHPTYSFDVKGQGEVVLSDLSTATRSGRLRLGDPAVYVISDGRRETIVAEVAPSRADAVVSLPPRRYVVQERRSHE